MPATARGSPPALLRALAPPRSAPPLPAPARSRFRSRSVPGLGVITERLPGLRAVKRAGSHRGGGSLHVAAPDLVVAAPPVDDLVVVEVDRGDVEARPAEVLDEVGQPIRRTQGLAVRGDTAAPSGNGGCTTTMGGFIPPGCASVAPAAFRSPGRPRGTVWPWLLFALMYTASGKPTVRRRRSPTRSTPGCWPPTSPGTPASWTTGADTAASRHGSRRSDTSGSSASTRRGP